MTEYDMETARRYPRDIMYILFAEKSDYNKRLKEEKQTKGVFMSGWCAREKESGSMRFFLLLMMISKTPYPTHSRPSGGPARPKTEEEEREMGL